MLIALSFVIVPSGMAGVRISQTRGTEAGTLYPGVHFVVPLVEELQLFDLRDKLFTTGIVEDGKKPLTLTLRLFPSTLATKLPMPKFLVTERLLA